MKCQYKIVCSYEEKRNEVGEQESFADMFSWCSDRTEYRENEENFKFDSWYSGI